MSIFSALLAFPNSRLLQVEAKIGILAGALLSGLIGFALLHQASRAAQSASGKMVE